jgi:hypothetical protein
VALKKLLDKMCQEPSRWGFNTMYDDMFDRNDQIKKWLEIESKKRRALSYDGDYHYGNVTTNLSKIFNNVLKSVCGLLIEKSLCIVASTSVC